MLLIGLTFRGKLSMTLGWDGASSERDLVEQFWDQFTKAIEEFLIDRRDPGPSATLREGLKARICFQTNSWIILGG
ncbi:uncharacterized protein EI90DRAFT_3054629 [Cantharellus anzutake]|uniref:uncharacterized protein n=1 Tax=Cantharellus anzutake TaxID=1750568 RepID=UPI001905CEFA|nr:uncharacterized protein EI90DRAFT_3101764 [Cantharellus anzutake]XP_038917144.1 uncharacterized protein EI90DRAFT_3054629 [Cantharellus anzutake]KAF8310335.1 hypothetical protein EI90DRAFT_3101764 [Cantharellus anzutake]KAF8332850.1 hypothetical protein EI90DRAFT_3054629 [Cantharellus anzutake]